MHRVTERVEWQPSRPGRYRSVWLKMECWQPTGSFKLRGIGHLARQAVAEGAEELVASSGGNAGLALAWAGRELDTPVTVVVPETTALPMQQRLRRLGATVQVHGPVWDEADRRARELASGPKARYVSPFDDPLIWAGHASLIEECATQGARPDRVVVAVGGGGLLCGVIEGLHRVGWGAVPVVAVETEGAASLKAAVDHGAPVALARIDSIAKSLGALKVADAAFEWTRRHPLELVQVSDARALAACLAFADDHRVLVEPACGAALSVVYDGLVNGDNILVVVCGGAAVGPDDLLQWRSMIDPAETV